MRKFPLLLYFQRMSLELVVLWFQMSWVSCDRAIAIGLDVVSRVCVVTMFLCILPDGKLYEYRSVVYIALVTSQWLNTRSQMLTTISIEVIQLHICTDSALARTFHKRCSAMDTSITSICLIHAQAILRSPFRARFNFVSGSLMYVYMQRLA